SQLERGQRHRAVDVRLHPVALDLVAEDDQRAFFLEPTYQVRVHLLARGGVRGEAKRVDASVGLLGLEAREIPRRRGVLQGRVEHVRVDRDAPPGAGNVEFLSDERLEVLTGFHRLHVERDPDFLELLAQDLARLDEDRYLRLHQICQRQTTAGAGLTQ